MKQWCDELGISYGTVKTRHRKQWDVDKLFTPVSYGK
jgi:hypothetical protein